MNKNEIELETKEMKGRLIYFGAFFLLTLSLFVLGLAHRYMVTIGLISLCFFIFNGVLVLYKAITFGFRRLLEVRKCRGSQ